MSHVDYIYQNEDYIDNPKDQFKRILKWLKKNTVDTKQYELLDLGCARGELISFLSKNVSNVNFTGIDHSNSLIDAARKSVPACFETADIERYGSQKKYDFVVISGVIEYFDDPNIVMERISSYLYPQGKCLILNIFNEYHIDVRVRYRNNKYFDDFKNGWSLHSIQTFYDILKNNNFIIENQEKFFPDCFLLPKEDPARSWMVRMPDNTLKYRNGLSQIYDSYILEVSKTI